MKSLFQASILSLLFFASAAQARTYMVYLQCSAKGHIRQGTLTIPELTGGKCVNTDHRAVNDFFMGIHMPAYSTSEAQFPNARVTLQFEGKTYSEKGASISYRDKNCLPQNKGNVYYPTDLIEVQTGYGISISFDKNEEGGYNGWIDQDDDSCAFRTAQ